MFTGIVTNVGKLKAITSLDKGKRFLIDVDWDNLELQIGASVCCNGICLTVVSKTTDCFEVEAWAETMALTNISSWKVGEQINLERSLRLGDELGGHLVFGHVDNVAKITELKDEGGACRYIIHPPSDLLKFIAPKGSVSLDGVSLTINSVGESSFDVLIIEHTLKHTNWIHKKVGDLVNIEVDQLARYCLRHMEAFR